MSAWLAKLCFIVAYVNGARRAMINRICRTGRPSGEEEWPPVGRPAVIATTTIRVPNIGGSPRGPNSHAAAFNQCKAMFDDIAAASD
jgi:hypothetical protein